VLASAGVILLVTLGFLCIAEGAASLRLVTRAPSTDTPREQVHTEFDRELGWINKPNVHIDDLYGTGLDFITNSQRFRNTKDFSRSIPKGKVRSVCTGDSFTLGYGVSNRDTWCELLTERDSRFETVNMGQGGYGVDQAYLWYRRDGVTLDHDVLIFAFTGGDFERMMCSTFLGYPKPVLTVAPGRPELSQASSRLRFVLRGVGQRLERFEHLRALELWRGRKPATDRRKADTEAMTLEQGRALASNIFEDLVRTAKEHRRSLLVVLLPGLADYRKRQADVWIPFLSEELERRHVPFLDLVTALRREPEELVPFLFRGHFNEAGNRWVADRVYEALVDIATLRERLRAIDPTERSTPRLTDTRPALAVEAVPLAGVRVRSNSAGMPAGLALDGNDATRWTSGAPQAGDEELVLDFGAPTSFRQIRLRLGRWGYDYGRHLAIDVGVDEAHYREVLRVPGDVTRIASLDETTEMQVLTLRESSFGRLLRIRQLARSEVNYWSVAEIAVFRDR
jgi:hypothetical protein